MTYTADSVMDSRLPSPVAAISFATVSVAVAVGLGVGILGWPFLVGIAALPVVLGVLYRPFFGVLLLVATIPVENILNIGGLGFGRAIGLVLFGAWLLQKVAKRQSWHRVVSNAFFPASIAFLAWVLASMLWAEHPLAVRSGFIRLAQMVALALVIIDLADSSRRVDLIAKTLLLSALLAAGTTLYQAEILGVRRAGGNISGGINGTAILLVTVIPLGFYLLRKIRNFGWKCIATLFLGIAVVSVVTTFSRLNLILLPPLFALFFLLAIRERHARGWLLAVTVTGAVGAVLFVPWDKLEERTSTIDTYVGQTLQFGQTNAETSSRGYHLRIGLAIARDHPIIGVGYGNYGYFFRDEYQFQVSGSDHLYETVRSPHSAYLGMIADLGAIGLASWIMLLTFCIVAGIRAWRRARTEGMHNLQVLAEAFVVMLGLHVFAYGFYAPHQTDKLLWIIMGLCVAMGYVVTAEIKPPGLHDGVSSARPELSPSVHLAGPLRRVDG